MSEHNYKFNVNMSCGGCSGAIERVLKKLEGILTSLLIVRSYRIMLRVCVPGVKEYEVSLESQTATVKTEESVDYATVLDKIKKTGKTVTSGEADGVSQPV
ncbi:iron/copper transporter Atx1 [Teratosphaeria destructans]|uniref:Iron/copper transporter Atx1 n=1 Tax=Teratosphaeria destructans TaxID=418781 RepID=A0A9W7SKB0_9PEZI|nr:iron/copper transporter Atx1 [Teratosphaeria destructans]